MIRNNIPPLQLPLLITGLAGVAGYNAFRHFSDRYPGQVIATRRADNWPLDGEGIVGCDAETMLHTAASDFTALRDAGHSLGIETTLAFPCRNP